MIALSDKIDGLDPVQDTNRTLRVFAPRCAGSFFAELYDDNGLTTDWREGAGRLVKLSLESLGGGRIHLSARADGKYRPVYGKIRIVPMGAVTMTLDPESYSLLSS